MKCVSPVEIKNPNGSKRGRGLLPGETSYLLVPCGKCVACRAARAKEWTNRLLCEFSSWKGKATFLTLTYSDDFLPKVTNGIFEMPTLRKKHFQDFMKRFRSYLPSGQKIKYFYCGEYGEETGRPHYHVILFGVTLSQALKISDICWTFGFSKVGTVTIESIRYVAGYVQKKLSPGVVVYDFQEQPFQGLFKGYLKEFYPRKSDATSAAKVFNSKRKKSAVAPLYVQNLGFELF